MRRLYLRDCQPGDVIEDVYVLSGKQIATGSNNKQYIKGFIGDCSAQLVARMWNATREIFNALPESGFVRVRARIENYQSNLQVVIEQAWPAKEGTYELGDLLPQTTKDIGQMCSKLQEMLGSIQNRHLAALIQAYLDDEQLMHDFCRAPAAMSFHHSFLGGLLEHTLNAIEVADAVVKFYPGLNRDMVIAGIFLHDIAKTWELHYDCSFGYTDGGQLIGHIVKSAMWVEHKAKEAEKLLGGEKLPQPLIDVIQHIILSHHDRPEFGSPKVPATPEAVAVHMIENMDAKLMMALSVTRGPNVAAAADGNWTDFQKAFGVRLYRPDVAPADANAPEPPAAPDTDGAPTVAGRIGPDGASPAPAAVDTLAISNPLFEATPAKRR